MNNTASGNRVCASCNGAYPIEQFQLTARFWSPYCLACRSARDAKKLQEVQERRERQAAARQAKADAKKAKAAAFEKRRVSIERSKNTYELPTPTVPAPLPPRTFGTFSDRAGAMDAFLLPSLRLGARHQR